MKFSNIKRSKLRLAPFLLLLNYDLDISGCGFNFTAATTIRVRHINASGGCMGGNSLRGQKTAFHTAGRHFDVDASGIASHH